MAGWDDTGRTTDEGMSQEPAFLALQNLSSLLLRLQVSYTC